MPQFYATDDLQAWITACIYEKFEAEFEDGDASEFILRLTKSVSSLKDECQELLTLSGLDMESTLMTAMLNTIDYKNLTENLQNQFEEELDELNKRILIFDKAAGIDHTDKSFSTDVGDVKCWFCNARGCDDIQNGNPIHKDCA